MDLPESLAILENLVEFYAILVSYGIFWNPKYHVNFNDSESRTPVLGLSATSQHKYDNLQVSKVFFFKFGGGHYELYDAINIFIVIDSVLLFYIR